MSAPTDPRPPRRRRTLRAGPALTLIAAGLGLLVLGACFPKEKPAAARGVPAHVP